MCAAVSQHIGRVLHSTLPATPQAMNRQAAASQRYRSGADMDFCACRFGDPVQPGGVQGLTALTRKEIPARSARASVFTRGIACALPDARSGWSRSPDSVAALHPGVLIFVFVHSVCSFRFCHRCRALSCARSSSRPLLEHGAHYVAAVVVARLAGAAVAQLLLARRPSYSMAVDCSDVLLGVHLSANALWLATAMRNLVCASASSACRRARRCVPRPRPPASWPSRPASQ